MHETVTGRHLRADHLRRILVLRRSMLLAGALALGGSLCLAQTAATTRAEATDQGISYSGEWVHGSGSAIVLNQSGARASISFTGTGITWIGEVGSNRGVARVNLDGTANTVDTYSDVSRDQQVLFVAKGLTMGLHNLTIEVTQMRNVSAGASGIGIDAFDISNGAVVTGNVVANPGYIEQNNPAVTYSGNWYLNTSSRESGGSAVLAVDPGAKATVAFNGTGIIWIGFMDPWSGLTKVYVDGVPKLTLDTYGAPYGDGFLDDIWQRPIWGVTDLPNGPHTFTIEVLGQFTGRSNGAWIWVDAFKILGPLTATASTQ